jgi:F-type H+-transporting ATPase subunit c
MEQELIKMIVVGATIVLGTMMPAMAISKIGSSANEAIGRNPEAAPRLQTAMILAIAFAEALGIYSLVIALIIKFV